MNRTVFISATRTRDLMRFMVSFHLAIAGICNVFGHGDSISTATSISIGNSVSGAIDWGGDPDYFSVQLSSSGTLAAYTTGSTDTYGYIYDASGSEVTHNDDDPYPNFRVSASVGAGTYYILVRHYSSSGTGDYLLNTEFTSGSGSGGGSGGSDDHGNGLSSATLATVNTSVSGTINYGGDEDYFQIQVGSSGTLSASTSGTTDTYGYLLNSVGSSLITNDDNPYPNFGFSYSLSAGTYYVRVRHYSGTGIGAYTLSLGFTASVGGGGGGPVSLGESLDNTVLSWSTYGNGSWNGQTGIYYSGGDAAQSPWINHNEYTTVETSVTGPGLLSFSWRVSSESCCDHLRFYIDSVQQNQISGEIGWTYQSFNLASGTHTLRWTYTTDGSVHSNANAGWLDDVQFTLSGAPPPSPPASTTPDLIWRQDNSGLNAVWFMSNGSLVESKPILPDIVADLDWEIVGSGDFNSDGESDLVWQHRTLGFIGIWFMNGRAMTSTALTEPNQASDLGWRIVGVADFNLDGHPDLLWQHETDATVAIWHMDGVNLTSATLTTPSVPTPQSWKLMGTGDFNHDGFPDLLWEDPSWGYVVIWHMAGSSLINSFYTSPPILDDPNWRAVGTGDLNQDGNVDIVRQHETQNSVAVWYMNDYSLIYSTPLQPASPDSVDWKLQAVGEILSDEVDLDGDLMPDAWEMFYFGDLSQAGYTDYDGDGVNNLQEYRTENDPIQVNLTIKISRPRNGTNIP